MKFFIYKSLIVFFLAFLLFKLTISTLIKDYEKKIDFYLSKDNAFQIKEKLRDEMESALQKESYLNPEDAELIRKFLEKLQKEIFIEK